MDNDTEVKLDNGIAEEIVNSVESKASEAEIALLKK